MDNTQDGVEGTLLSERDISEGFDRLIAENRLFGAELNPTTIKKSGKGGLFLFRKLPSRHRMLSLWWDLFSHHISPEALLVELAGGLHWFYHSNILLLFGKDRVIYDCQIRRANEAIGHITLALYRERDRVVPFLPIPTRPGHRVVYIEGITLSAQSTGYASFLFRRYERLFHELRFHLIRLNAGLSVGKYYWAKEGFDCSNRGQFQQMQDRLWALVRRLSLPVAEQEVRRLPHMSDVAAFRPDLKVRVWRDAEGYYTLEHDTTHPEEFLFPLGKAFLLCAPPWE
ncbi:MAG TPA: hypothetical protein VFK23_05525, partial [Nitrospirota bacterium]|nr:hypothetical protein [Nitrospirota bacterium]